jgi:hypothetical protein
MDLINSIIKYNLGLCKIFSQRKEDYLSYILRAYQKRAGNTYMLSSKKRVSKINLDVFRNIGVTFPVINENNNVFTLFKMGESYSIDLRGLHKEANKLDIFHNSIGSLGNFGTDQYLPHAVIFGQINNLRKKGLIWAVKRESEFVYLFK